MKRLVPALIAGISALVLFAEAGQAAVTVLGNGQAHACFEAAEFGTNPVDGIGVCTDALERVALSIRDRAATLVNRGILFSRREDTARALADYDKGLSLNPGMGEAYVDRAAVMIVLRRYDEAIKNLNQGIALNSPRIQIAYYDRAVAEEATGNIRGAYDDFKKAAEIEPGFELAKKQLARFRVIQNSHGGT